MLEVLIVRDDVMIADEAQQICIGRRYEICGVDRAVAEAVVFALPRKPDLGVLYAADNFSPFNPIATDSDVTNTAVAENIGGDDHAGRAPKPDRKSDSFAENVRKDFPVCSKVHRLFEASHSVLICGFHYENRDLGRGHRSVTDYR